MRRLKNVTAKVKHRVRRVLLTASYRCETLEPIRLDLEACHESNGPAQELEVIPAVLRHFFFIVRNSLQLQTRAGVDQEVMD